MVIAADSQISGVCVTSEQLRITLLFIIMGLNFFELNLFHHIKQTVKCHQGNKDAVSHFCFYNISRIQPNTTPHTPHL